ncbi:hypothetical protein [Bacteroides sp. 224]|uniref:hypothetical protein n=1 Tax=Bacteroides sp. 224 TaxID=2302936 RepID=UPI0013D6720A|nr:hypothetical protein [Bacteroides sp. 224]NDV63937.1 hypothetical protein [Bacteroides sp. 224]
MAQHIVKPNQNIFDVALELYGSVEGLFDLLISNESLTMNTDLKTGTRLEYHDYFVINDGIVKSIKENNYIPANGERHVYFKKPNYDLFAVCGIDNKIVSSSIIIGGQGNVQIDWGDNSDLETIALSNQPQEITHYFDSIVDTRRLKFYGDCTFTTFDASNLNGDMFLTRPLIVDEYISKSNGYSLKGLFLFEGTVILNLQGMVISELEPISDMSLQELNLLNVRFTDVSVLDNYLQYIATNYGNRRNCVVLLNTTPTEKGMQAIQTIINEPSWNDAGKWKFIINGDIYTKE